MVQIHLPVVEHLENEYKNKNILARFNKCSLANSQTSSNKQLQLFLQVSHVTCELLYGSI